jgi:hypothetical protein
MSDVRVRAAIETMEAWLADPGWNPEAEALDHWEQEFQAALAQAEKAPGWLELVDRAHAAGRRLEARTQAMIEAQARLRAELESHERGNRALRGYQSSSR